MIFQSVDLIMLYPYKWQIIGFGIALMIWLPVMLALYGVYRLIIFKVNKDSIKILDRILFIAVIVIFSVVMTELVLSLITIFNVNKQLGFSYATPETPEGELFVITKVKPGKTMDMAGLKVNDQVQINDCDLLYEILINKQADRAYIPVIRNGKKMIIMVNVPMMYLPLSRVSFLF